MSDYRKVIVVIDQVVQHRVQHEVDAEEVLAWAVLDAPTGAPTPPLTGELIQDFMEADRDVQDELDVLLSESTEQEPHGADIDRVELVS